MNRLRYVLLRGLLLNGLIGGIIIAYTLNLLIPDLPNIKSTILVIVALGIAGILRSNIQFNHKLVKKLD